MFKDSMTALSFISVTAKLCVGLVQAWILAALAIRLSEVKAREKLIRIGGYLVLAVTITGFIAATAITLVSKHKEANMGIAFL